MALTLLSTPPARPASAFAQALYYAAPRLSKHWFSAGEACTAAAAAAATGTTASARRAFSGLEVKQTQLHIPRCTFSSPSIRRPQVSTPTSRRNFSSLSMQCSQGSEVRLRQAGSAKNIHQNALRHEMSYYKRWSLGRLGTSRTFVTVGKHAAQIDTFSSSDGGNVVLEDHTAGQEEAKQKTKESFFPETSSNTVAYWLLASAASVFGIVVFGGLTRLTESGLSITEWRPVTGSLPPLSEADWESEFAKYRSSPEFKVLNSRMTLDEFKSIYWMEWIHRIWGRAVGLTFILPAAYFVARRRVSRSMMFRLLGIGGLIGFQGFIGWWMVKSGLKDDFISPDRKPGRDVPRVSQYRLAAHLGTAFVCYLAMLWNGLSILRTNKLVHTLSTDAASAQLFALRNPALRPFKISIALLACLVFTTAMSGALVAGLDAGLIYNEFPYMGLGLTPPKSELFDSFYSHKPDGSDLYMRNFLENPSLVQLDHRILATSTFTAVMALWAYTRFSHNMKSFLPKAAARGVHGVVGFVWLQVILGISTLIYMVPLPLASAHQAGALALLTWTTVLGSRIWFPTHAARLVQKRMAATVGGGSTQKSAAYELPAIPKVKPQLGQGDESVLRASLGWPALGQFTKTDAGLAAGSLLVALAVLGDRQDSKVQKEEFSKARRGI